MTKLIKRLSELSQGEFSESKQVRLAKKLFVLENENTIKHAAEAGYNNTMIADAATAELLEAGLPAEFTIKTKEGEEKTKETKFSAKEIKSIVEGEE